MLEPASETIAYRPVSKVAVAAVGVGLLSSLALTTPVLWILPLLGIAVAIVGLADVTRSGAEKAGRAAALVGLALSVGFGAQAVTAAVVSRTITESRVRAVASLWCNALRENRLAEAQSMLSPRLLPAAHSDHPGHEDGDEHTIGSLPAVMAIRGCGDTAIHSVENTGRNEEDGKQWGVRIRLSPCADGGAVEVYLQLQPEIVNEPTQRVERWTISQIDLGP
jgi:hypothetical protein